MEISPKEIDTFKAGARKLFNGLFPDDPAKASDMTDRTLALLALSSEPKGGAS